jgi:hypothetical protein
LILAIGFTAITAYSQNMREIVVPAVVKTAFLKQFPGAKSETWEKENENYEAQFDNIGEETTSLYSATGVLLETETVIEANELPKTISDYVSKKLAGKSIEEATKIIDANGTLTYEAEIDEADYVFDAKGNFMKKEVESAENED